MKREMEEKMKQFRQGAQRKQQKGFGDADYDRDYG